MNKYVSFFALVACICATGFTPAEASFISTSNQIENTLDNTVGVHYTVEILALDRNDQRTFFSGRYKSFNQAYLAYQGFLFDLPEDATLIYAKITDSDGRTVVSTGD